MKEYDMNIPLNLASVEEFINVEFKPEVIQKILFPQLRAMII